MRTKSVLWAMWLSAWCAALPACGGGSHTDGDDDLGGQSTDDGGISSFDMSYPVTMCQTNADCPAAGQTCQHDGTCACPMNEKRCGPRCIDDTACCVGSDCRSGVCLAGSCQAPACNDGLKNGNETDIDCGGSCGGCAGERACKLDTDCQSMSCQAGTCAAPSVTFGPARYYGMGSVPNVALGDLDGDGHLDAVLALYERGGVAIERGDGRGGFGAPSYFEGAQYTRYLALGDFDGDGKLDVVTAWNGGLATRLGDGHGGFGVEQAVAGRLYPSGVLLPADYDGDGKLDVAFASYGQVVVLPGKGDGRFAAPQVVAATGLNSTRYDASTSSRLVVIDLDGDGKPDLVSGNRVLLNAGGFFFVPGFALSGEVADAGDLNGDGKMDLVAGGTAWLGRGDGSFEPAFSAPGTQLADVNGDGQLDLVSAGRALVGSSYVGQLSVSLGLGDGSFGAAQVSVLDSYTYSSDPLLRLGDLDGDGKADALAFQAHALFPAKGQGDGSFQPWPAIDNSSDWDGLSYPLLADFDGDGKADLAVLRYLPQNDVDKRYDLAIYRGGASGTLTLATTLASSASSYSDLRTGDFNGDGKPDLFAVAGDNPTPSSVWLNQGGLRFSSPISYGNITKNGAQSFVIGDFNGDGRTDLLRGGGNIVAVTLTNADGTPGIGVNSSTGGHGLYALLVGDVDGDGNLDLVDFDVFSDLPLYFLRGHGDGQFDAAVSVEPKLDHPNQLSYSNSTLGDLNGDGKADFIFADSTSDKLWVIKGQNGGFGAAKVAYPESFSPLQLLDLNRDGKLDLRSGGGFLLGKGDGTFGEVIATGYPVSAVGDLDGDGKLDLVGVSSSSPTSVLVVVPGQ